VLPVSRVDGAVPEVFEDAHAAQMLGFWETHRDAMPAALESFARDRLSTAKLPRTVELVEELPRNEAGKVRRAALVDDRRPTTSPLPDPS